MKKKNILWSILGLLLVLVSCSQDLDEAMPTSSTQQQRSVATNHFYGTVAASQTATRGIAQLDKVWRAGTTIKVKLLNDPYNMADKIKEAAMEWEEYANIKFRFVEANEDAHVRIGFDWNENRWITWSYTGTDCKIVTKQNEPTMSFAFFDILTEEERQGDILRAFGQVLGLELEHRHLDFDAGWTKYISQYWVGEIEDIPWDELKKYVFDPLDVENVMQTDEYDENSIMIWPFNRKYANNTARDFNNKLSDKDKEFIDKLYPGKEKAIITMKVENSLGLTITIITSSDLIIDWGDGEKTTYLSTDIVVVKHYPNDNTREIKFYGDPATITKLALEKDGIGNENKKLSNIDISKCINLKHLDIIYWKITNIDLSKNINLETFSCNTSDFDSLDLSRCKKLKHLGLDDSKLSNLDLSKCLELESFNFYGNNLVTLDISKCINLKSLTLSCPKITSLDLTKYIGLEYLTLNNNKFSFDLSKCTSLQYFSLYSSNITNLDLSKNSSLRQVLCNKTNLTKLNISDCTNLESLRCEENNLDELNLSGCTKLTSLNCSGNNLSSLDVSTLTRLLALHVTSNPLYYDEAEMKSIANQLANCRTNGTLGSFRVNKGDFERVYGWIGDIVTPKNWRIY